MKKLARSYTVETSAASMADIAFLLLIFFMVTTTIVNDKGLDLVLPPYQVDRITSNINERNLFAILINSEDKLMVENELRNSYLGLRSEMKTFVLNNGSDITSSDNPTSAVISIKANRGTTQEMFLHVLDEAKAAYYEIYAERLNVKIEIVRSTEFQTKGNKRYQKLRKEIPMNISIAEPD